MIASGIILTLALVAPSQTVLPGTQPRELTEVPGPSHSCNCHAVYSDTHVEPGRSYRATMMSLSARDPLFRSALRIAHRDRPEVSDLCIRCHAPNGWLAGRSTPGDGSLLESDDLESVTCDFCHRMVPSTVPPQLIGDGQFTLSQDSTKRAFRGVGPARGHRVAQSNFVGSSEACGTCHSLFSPSENAHSATGAELGGRYYEQRTYEEWRDSFFPARGRTCIECHMQKVRGLACQNGSTMYDDLRLHLIVGGNDFSPRAIDMVDPDFPIDSELPELILAVQESLRSSARLVVTSTLTRPVVVRGNDSFEIGVRLYNLTGHKLPTGYPEGRRVYLEVTMKLAGSSTQTVSGAWDPATGNLVPDPQLRTYETQHGRFENGSGGRTHHVAQMNQILSDTRIPPEGFTPQSADMIPSGRNYGPSPPYRHYDDHRYTITAPDVSAATEGTITIRAKYQVTDGEVVGFLIDTAGRDSPESRALSTAWEGLGHAPPNTMASVTVPIRVERALARPDAGPVDGDAADARAGADSGTEPGSRDATPSGSTDSGSGGCGCSAASERGPGASPVARSWFLGALLLGGACRRGRSNRGTARRSDARRVP